MKELEELGILNREQARSMSARIWARILQALKEAWPAEEKLCRHSCGWGYCPQEGCPNYRGD